MKIATVPTGLLETNCYLVRPDDSRTLYVIDPGADARDIADRAAEFDYDRVAVLLTHAHVDHISGLGELCRLLRPAYVYLRGPDQAFYASPENSLPPYLPAAKDLPAVTGSTEDSDFKVIPLPGAYAGRQRFPVPGRPSGAVRRGYDLRRQRRQDRSSRRRYRDSARFDPHAAADAAGRGRTLSGPRSGDHGRAGTQKQSIHTEFKL